MESGREDLITRVLFICPESFQVNCAIDPVDGIGGNIITYAYSKKANGQMGFSTTFRAKISDWKGLLAIYVLCELTTGLEAIFNTFESVLPEHTPRLK